MDAIWRVELMGGLVARRCDGPDDETGERVITRFRTQKTGALLARLAFERRPIAREVLIDELWPDATQDTGRNNLRIALSSLRRQLEPPDVAAAAVLRSGRTAVELMAHSVVTDVAEFEAHRQSARLSRIESERRAHLQATCEIFRSPLLPGYYESWIPAQAQRLESAFFVALNQLLDQLESQDDIVAARDWLQCGLAIDPERSELQRRVARLAGPLSGDDRVPQLLSPSLSPPASVIERHAAASKPTSHLDGANGGENGNSTPENALLSLNEPSLRVRLPVVWTRFFARETEIERLTEWLSGEERLVTLCGPGGCGKTRLAMEIARRLARAALPSGNEQSTLNGAPDDQAEVRWQTIAFVPLSALARADLIGEAIADVLQLPRADEKSAFERIVAALSPQRALLVLDNFEQIAIAGALVVQALLERLPGLSVLVTSRHRLRLAGEREWTLSPLPVPVAASAGLDVMASLSALSPQQALEWPSVRLFVDRAQATRADFALTRRNTAAVVEVLRRLDGLPLAIELAAARVGALSPGAMLEQLQAPLDFLQGRRATDERQARFRHSGLRACIEWSFRLLPPEQQRFWTRLSVFRGAWSLEAAHAVSNAPDADLASTLSLLEALCDASFVRFDERSAGPDTAPATDSPGNNETHDAPEEEAALSWFEMLEVLRAFADEQLGDDERIELQRRHAEYFANLAERMEAHFVAHGQWMGAPDAAQENFRALLDRALEHHTPALTEAALMEAALRTAGALWWFWPAHGHGREARDYLRHLLEQDKAEPSGVPDNVRAKARLAAGMLAYHLGHGDEARRYLEASLQAYRALDSRVGIAATLNYLGAEALVRLDVEAARQHYAATLALHREGDNVRQIAIALSCLAGVEVAAGDLEACRQYCDEAMALWHGLNYGGGIAWLLSVQGIAAEMEESWPAARELQTRALQLRRAQDAPLAIATALFDLARVAAAQNFFDEAFDLGRESVLIRLRLGHHRELLHVLEGLANVLPWLPESGSSGPPSSARALQTPLAPVAEPLNASEPKWERARRAARVLGATQAWRESLNLPRPPHLERVWQQALQYTRTALGAQFEVEHQIGRTLSIEEAVHCALNDTNDTIAV